MTCPCCKGACGDDNGDCTQESQQDCEDAGGVWKGIGTQCGDYDWESGCCTDHEVESCTLSTCIRGYKASECDDECDPDPKVPIPSVGVINCKDGTPNSATVTGSGVTFSTGSASLDADLDDAMNASYAINFECDGTHDGSSTSTDFSYPGTNGTFTVRITLTFQPVRVASISVFFYSLNPSLMASMELNDGNAVTFSDTCTVVYECELFSGAPTSSASPYGANFTAANIDVS